MMMRSIVLTTFLAVIMCSCAPRCSSGKQPAAATPQPSQTQAATPPPSPVQAPQTTPQSETQQATAAQEQSGDEPPEDPRQTRADSGLERLAQMPADQQLPAGSGWRPGVNYDALVPSQPTSVGAGKVEVVEVFWLGCPHCYALEPYLQAWLKTKPSYVEFVRVPVMWGPVHRAHAHLFYTLMALNRPDLVQKAFDAIQQQHQMLVGPSEDETLKAQQDFAKANGVSPEEYAKAYNSFSVNTNLQHAESLTQRYHVEGVPLVVIDGKYTTDVGKAGGPDKLIALINDLSAAQHRH